MTKSEQTMTLQTDLGTVHVDWCGQALKGIRLGKVERHGQCIVPQDGVSVAAQPVDTIKLLEQYFQGERVTFPQLDLSDFTSFQQEVWGAARDVPFGQTTSYGQIAQRLGRAGVARAVGAALGQNPFPPLIPCHRVISSSGHLTGFAYGLAWKRGLLDLERSQRSLF